MYPMLWISKFIGALSKMMTDFEAIFNASDLAENIFLDSICQLKKIRMN